MVNSTQLGVDLQADVADGLLVQLLGRWLEDVILEEALSNQTKLHVTELLDLSIQEASLLRKSNQHEINLLLISFEMFHKPLELVL